ncbi:hypothetical protein, conserved [Babesia ovata]|uniref:Uncharacterized protein n=1 Tax=Babesia ovata TaxID=189622 RepID=A0A2H6KC57_9APIC|nr:uncharacterized protein BOVATA_020710 [Babesia ovata]GBE60578.1 hypothetical protein, conserved [Babesia ovata]
MATCRSFFFRFKGLCTRRKEAALVREPTVAVPIEEVPPPQPTEAPSSETTGEASVSSIDVPLLPINNVLSPSSIATTREPDAEEFEIKNDTPLVTEDVYDPLIMSFSPRVSRRRNDAAKGDTCNSPSKAVSSFSETEALSTSCGHAAEQGVFWYGITLLSDVGNKPVADHAQKTDAPVLDEHISTDMSADCSPSKLKKCRSSLRYYDLMGHRISEDWTNLNSRVYDALLQYFTGSDPTSGHKISKQWSDNVKLLMGKKTAKIVAAFKVAYQGQLDFESSYMICQSVFTAQKSMRIDLIIRARVMSCIRILTFRGVRVMIWALGNQRMPTAEGDPASSLDRMHREWYTVGPNSHYLQQLFPADIVAYNLVQPEKLQPELEHQLTQVAGIDVITSRSRFIAAKPGHITEAQSFIGHTMEVIDARQPVVCMLQRAGIQCDRLCHVQLRVGDKVRFYTTKG